MHLQDHNPSSNVWLPPLVAAIPIAAPLYFIAPHPHRDCHSTRFEL